MLESMVSLHSHVTRLGVLDIGSNTVHMLIVDAAPGARPEPEASTKSTVRWHNQKGRSRSCGRSCGKGHGAGQRI